MAKLKVVFYRHSLFNRGGDRVILEYANDLAEKGHQVALYVNQVNTRFTIHPGVRVVPIPLKTRLGTFLYALFARFNADLVIVDIIPLPFLLRFSNRVLYLAQAYDTMYYKSLLLRKMISLLYRLFFRMDQFNTISDSAELTRLFEEKYAAKGITTVQIGIDPGRFYREPDQRLLGLKENRKAVLILSRADRYRKGGDFNRTVLGSLAKRQGTGHWEVWAVGDPISLGHGIQVRHFGSPSDDELRRLLSSADVFFYPSRHEGFGLFPLEAMACGCVVVTTTAVPYAVDGENLLAAEVEDMGGLTQRLASALTEPSFCLKIRERAAQFAGKFDSCRSRQAFEAALLNLCPSVRLDR